MTYGDDLERSVRVEADALAHLHPNPGWRYQSVAALVLEHGGHWTPQRRPAPWTAKRANRMCFANAGADALAFPELTYVEGYAMPARVHAMVLHAWCVTLYGKVIDRTWPQAMVEHSAYYGVPFSTGFLVRLVKDFGAGSVLWPQRPWDLDDPLLLRDGLPDDALAAI